MRYFKVCLVLLLALFATQAQAQSQKGFYAGGLIGMTIYSDADVSSAFGNAEYQSDVGLGFGAVGGYDFGNNIRAEGEITYRYNGADRWIDGGGTTILDGHSSSFAFMANGFYDFNLGQFVPYVGAGLGFAILSAELDAAGVNVLDDSDVAFAWQIAAGVGYKISPKFILSVDYRLFATTDAELTLRNGTNIDVEYFTHNLMVGGRYKF